MNHMEFDTEKIKECSNDINLLIYEIKELFDDTFDTLYNMIDKKNIWLGNSADMFKNEVLLDRQNYIYFKEQLCKYSLYLSDYSDELNQLIGVLKR